MTLRGMTAAWSARATDLAGRLSLPVVVLLWAALSLPNLGLRAFYFEEGRNAMHAMSLLEGGRWFADSVAGERFVVRLPLQTWGVAGFAAIVGGVNEWAVRLPALAAVLATLFVVYRVVRDAVGTVPAAFAALSLLTSVGIIQRLRLGEPDTPIMALSFVAFAVWFGGIRRGRVAPWRWLLCGLIMAAVCGYKGPQPCAYFLAGAGMFALIRRRWADLPGLATAALFPVAAFAAWFAVTREADDLALWLAEFRLRQVSGLPQGGVADHARFAAQVLIEWLPPLLLAAPLWWRMLRSPERAQDLPLALLLYAATVTLVLVAWPGARARYALPALPAVAVAAGLGFHALRDVQPRLLAAAVTIGAGVAAYQLVLVVGVMTLMPDPFTRNRDAARAIAGALAERPAPVLMVFPAHNVAAYLGAGVEAVPQASVSTRPGPAWLLGVDAQIAALRRADPRIEPAVPLPVATSPPLALARLAPR